MDIPSQWAMSLIIFFPKPKEILHLQTKLTSRWSHCKITCAALRCINPYAITVIRLHTTIQICKIQNGNSLWRKIFFKVCNQASPWIESKLHKSYMWFYDFHLFWAYHWNLTATSFWYPIKSSPVHISVVHNQFAVSQWSCFNICMQLLFSLHSIKLIHIDLLSQRQ